MSDVTIVGKLSAKLKKIRKAQSLTLDQLAKKSSVSRSMLSQIERGDANPTIATLFNLSQALNIELSELIDDEQKTKNFIDHLKQDEIPSFQYDDAKASLKILSPPEMAGNVEIYELTISEDGGLISEPHRSGAVEHLTVLEGEAKVRAGNLTQLVGAGELARYNADVAHAITFSKGNEDQLVKAILVVMGA